MKVIKTKLKDCVLIEPLVISDERGFFMEVYRTSKFAELAGISIPFVQDNHSRSSKGVLRGLHFQKSKPQGKLVRVIRGEVFDVAVDLRPDSATFGQWESVILSEENKTQFYIPPGFAHGFVVLSNFADFVYKCTEYYDSSDQEALIWNDPDIGINWPVEKPILSHKDLNASKLIDLKL